MQKRWFKTSKNPPKKKGRYFGYFSSWPEGNRKHICYYDGEILSLENDSDISTPEFWKPLPQGPNERNNKKIFIIDLDGTICEDVPNEETEKMKKAREIPGAKEQINKWHENEHFICFFTARKKNEHEKITKKWLDDHGFKYDKIIFEKPRIKGNLNGYHFIDNHMTQATTFNGLWNKLVKKMKIIEVFDD